jgi:type 1 glutamine amidotransferase
MRVLIHLLGILLTTSLITSTSAETTNPTLLVFTKTAEYRHESIPTGVRMLRDLGHNHGFDIAHTEDAVVFEKEGLADYTAIVFLSTTGDVLNTQQQIALQRYINGGGAYVGIHAAADTEHDWPWYVGLVGAGFSNHPEIQTAVVDVEDRTHVSTRMLPERWERTDERYNYHRNPRGDVHVLMMLDEDSYEGGELGGDHPIAWCHIYDGGRSWYTGGGHTEDSYAEALFREHVLGGIRWAVGDAEGDCDG